MPQEKVRSCKSTGPCTVERGTRCFEPNSQSLTRWSRTELPVGLSLHQSQRKSPCRDGGSEPKAQGEPERPTVVQSVVDLAKAGRSQILAPGATCRRAVDHSGNASRPWRTAPARNGGTDAAGAARERGDGCRSAELGSRQFRVRRRTRGGRHNRGYGRRICSFLLSSLLTLEPLNPYRRSSVTTRQSSS